MSEMDAPDFRELFDVVNQKDSRNLYWYVLYPWVEAHPEHLAWLHSFAEREGKPIPTARYEELWELYALNRANDILLQSFERRADGADDHRPTIAPDEYLRFVESLGFTPLFSDKFSPFYHEIVAVEQAEDPDQPPTLLATDWPCLMLGNMVFSRAGARVSAGSNFMIKEIAETSTLYWAYRRKNRPHHDLSVGWGSNSQWRTSFRRDYCIGERFYYNVDGKFDLNQPKRMAEDDYELSRAERIELLLHRCFVKTRKTPDDHWPYNDRYTTPS